MNGNFLGLGADYAVNASVKVDASQPAGILITNGEFTAFHDATFAPNATSQAAQIVVGPNNKGPVQLSNTAFWGPDSMVARLQGSDTTTFSSCVFQAWSKADPKAQNAAIELEAGNLVVQGCEFQTPGKQLHVGPNANKVIFVGNMVKGPKNVVIDAQAQQKANIQIGLNAFDDK